MSTFLTPGIEAAYSTARAAPLDGADKLFPKKAALAALFPPAARWRFVRGTSLFLKPIAVFGSAGKAVLKVADADENAAGALAVDLKDFNAILGAFEGLLNEVPGEVCARFVGGRKCLTRRSNKQCATLGAKPTVWATAVA